MTSNTEEFTKKAKKVHGNKYDYSKVEYINCDTKITIICKEHGEFPQTPYCHLIGQKCPECAGNKKKTTREFIENAKKTHGNKYDYSKVDYIDNKTKIIIICKEHGEFLQTPHAHLHGQGCRKCAGTCKKTTEEFIKKAKKVHGDKYDYSKADYIDNKTKIIIICKKHGEFPQTPFCHLVGHGCQKCGEVYRPTNEEFIKNAKKIHGNKYDYSKVEYINNGTKVIIICKEHGEFPQKPNNHLNGQKCPKCPKNAKSTTQKFIEKAKKIHGNKYDYSKVEYNGSFEKVIIICPDHGEFLQQAFVHLEGHGCKKCVGVVSKISQIWLDSLNVPIEYREKSIKIGKKRFKLDAFDADAKKIYEFNGDFWHGNPEKYDPNDINPVNNVSYGELYKMTIDKKNLLEKNGYTVISIWEKDFRDQLESQQYPQDL